MSEKNKDTSHEEKDENMQNETSSNQEANITKQALFDEAFQVYTTLKKHY